MVAGAPAEVALQPLPDLALGGIRVLREQRRRRHHHARRAEAALQAVLLRGTPLHRVQLAVRTGQALQRGDLAPVGLRGEHRAGLHRLAVEQHRAGPAGGGVAADVGRREPAHLAQEVHEQQPRLDVVGALLGR